MLIEQRSVFMHRNEKVFNKTPVDNFYYIDNQLIV